MPSDALIAFTSKRQSAMLLRLEPRSQHGRIVTSDKRLFLTLGATMRLAILAFAAVSVAVCTSPARAWATLSFTPP